MFLGIFEGLREKLPYLFWGWVGFCWVQIQEVDSGTLLRVVQVLGSSFHMIFLPQTRTLNHIGLGSRGFGLRSLGVMLDLQVLSPKGPHRYIVYTQGPKGLPV